MSDKELNGYALDFIQLHDLYDSKDMGEILKYIERLLKEEEIK